MLSEDGGIRVRDAALADAERLTAWAAAMAWETERRRLDPDTLGRGVRLGLEDPARARYFVAERVGESGAVPAGTLMLTREWSDWRAGEWWWIQSVYVPPACRRLGVLRALYAHVLGLARSAPGVCGLRLYVARDNRAAQEAYARLGMQDPGYSMFEAELPPQRILPHGTVEGSSSGARVR
ncbi:MAG TPA: GNAT family N-acetyltransferase [Myxococcota bacterium]|nr:GNAT family N-acetyltransferase [Myxococcota bacterium]HRY97002.1 GNAT family N-acetyltransferase [Myxococcota bacterium]HSA21246.1 GNAT family N-acetyltransferase [Myxococcota bacterium]